MLQEKCCQTLRLSQEIHRTHPTSHLQKIRDSSNGKAVWHQPSTATISVLALTQNRSNCYAIPSNDRCLYKEFSPEKIKNLLIFMVSYKLYTKSCISDTTKQLTSFKNRKKKNIHNLNICNVTHE